MKRNIKKAAKKMEASCQGLIEAVKNEYPIGCTRSVKLSGYVQRIEITGFCEWWWSNPGMIYGNNIRTGKRRKFDYTDIVD